ncbi:MAG: hypothetical protein A2749_00540 [Parcubacteria group bacterium RIFCSPHIGHO2_01_FULL_45_26]|nr:MAG: hypothetical protein A2749_00540 [Parcubacteria group bacterium RIFCSPHIGHO2_01_FULL_45_26]
MNIRFTDHAKFRLQERGISTEAIKKTILIPEQKVKRSDGKIVVTKSFVSCRIRVVYIMEGTAYLIITIIKL